MPNRCGYEHWDVTTIDATGDAGQALSLAAEGGRLWVAYRASSSATDTLRVAHYEAGTWTVEDLGSGALVAIDTAIALDASGAPHVAAPGPVRGGASSYAELFTRSAGGWTRQATVSGSATAVGLALDASGHAQICAYDPPSSGFGGFVVHVSEDGAGTFTSRTIDGSTSAASRVGSSCSIAVGTSGTLHAAYYDEGFGRLRYASRTGVGAWGAVTVDAPSSDYAGDDAFMRLAPDQTPTIVYRALVIGTPEIRRAHLAASTLYYTHETASGWAREVVARSTSCSTRPPGIACATRTASLSFEKGGTLGPSTQTWGVSMTSTKISIAGLAVLAAQLAVGCSCATSTGTRHDAGMIVDIDGNGFDVNPPHPDTGTHPDIDAGADVGNDAYVDRATFCMGRGPAVVVGDMTIGTATCAGAIASRVFDNAMCTCTNANVGGYMKTRSFDSGMGTMDMATGAPVGINETDTTVGYTDIGGTLVIAGTGGVNFGGYLDVDGDASFGGRVQAAGYIHVHRDLHADGNVTCVGAVTVDRDAYLTPGHNLITFPSVGGSTSHTAFTVAPPCDCAPADIVDIGAIVDYGRAHNDNADVGLMPNALEAVGIDVDIDLPCGRFYVDDISGLGSITLHVHGRTALYVGGDVNALGVLEVDLGTEGELDVFIAGNLLSIGLGSWGDRARPAASRLYVAGTEDVTLVGASGFVGNVYAPNARITAIGDTEVYGSLFGGSVTMPGYLSIHYDRAILNVDVDCPPPPGDCSCAPGEGCVDHHACVGGMCVGCTSDADCCAPLVCNPSTGSCGSLLI